MAVASMNAWGVKKILVMPPPFSSSSEQTATRYECTDMSAAVSKYSDRIALLCGGGSLNIMIQNAVSGQSINSANFKTVARQLADTTGFVGFGELAAEHFCLGSGHIYMMAPPDHPLFYALVDVASEKAVPIDLHMEAISSTMSFPTLTSGSCSYNPAVLTPNIDKFKNLLTYAGAKSPKVKIVWVHAGWDNTSQRSTTVCDELLGLYDNLYMNLKHSSADSVSANQVLDSSGNIKSEWLSLFNKYPTRIMMGADHFFAPAGTTPPGPGSFDSSWAIITKLATASSNLAVKIGYENAQTIYSLQ